MTTPPHDLPVAHAGTHLGPQDDGDRIRLDYTVQTLGGAVEVTLTLNPTALRALAREVALSPRAPIRRWFVEGAVVRRVRQPWRGRSGNIRVLRQD